MGLLEGQAQCIFVIGLTGDPEAMLTTIGVAGNVTPTVAGANIMFEEFEATFLELMGGAYVLNAAIWQQFPEGGIVEAQSTNAASPAAAGGTVLPSNTAILIHKFTNGVGRGRKGRMFIPGVPEDAADAGGVLSAGALSDWNDAAAEFLTTWNAGEDLPELYLNRGVTQGGGSDQITSMTCDARVATQRRRMRP